MLVLIGFYCTVIARLQQMMWALEYDPDLFSMYEEPEFAGEKAEGSKGKPKSIRQCGKYERENLKNGGKSSDAPLPISVFLVASVLKEKSSKLQQEARGLDDVIKVSMHLFLGSILVLSLRSVLL